MKELLDGLRRLDGLAEAPEDSPGRVAASALRALPFGVDLVSGGDGGDQMLAFLNQEILRYDGLLEAIAGSLRETIEVCEGRVVCTPAVEAASRSLALALCRDTCSNQSPPPSSASPQPLPKGSSASPSSCPLAESSVSAKKAAGPRYGSVSCEVSP